MYKMITQKCNFCGNEFDAVRKSAKYCSNSCKTKANIQRRKEEIECKNSHQVTQESDGIEPEKSGVCSESLQILSKAENLGRNPEGTNGIPNSKPKGLTRYDMQLENENVAFRLKALGLLCLVGLINNVTNKSNKNSDMSSVDSTFI